MNIPREDNDTTRSLSRDREIELLHIVDAAFRAGPDEALDDLEGLPAVVRERDLTAAAAMWPALFVRGRAVWLEPSKKNKKNKIGLLYIY
jgi:hypothetical protein